MKLALLYLFVAAACVVDCAVPPTEQRIYPPHTSTHLQHVNPLDYYMQNPMANNYFRPKGRVRGDSNSFKVVNRDNTQPAHLENLEPDSEVELVAVPGQAAPQPPQPRPQNPVPPNIPNLIPDQRIFIVHMPIPGYSPGSIGGYQPVYIVGAGADTDNRYPGYQNAVILGHAGSTILTPLIGYGQRAIRPPGPMLVSPFQRPYDLTYPDPDPDIVSQSIKTEQEPSSLHIVNAVKFQNPIHRLVYLKPVDPADGAAPYKNANASGPNTSSPTQPASTRISENPNENRTHEGSSAVPQQQKV